jgi:hypothetical protein
MRARIINILIKGIALAVIYGALAPGCIEPPHETQEIISNLSNDEFPADDIMVVDGVVDIGRGAEVSLVASTASDTAPPGTLNVASQSNWRWCHKCQGLFFAGNPNPVCPAGGAHENVGSGHYYLAYDMLPTAGWQNDWRWCHKCQGLFFGGNPNPVCPAGGAHENIGSANYSLYHGPAAPPPYQGNWRWCHKCQGLFFAGNPNPVCPAGGAHTLAGSGHYNLYLR